MMPATTRFLLSVMMFAQYFVWGAWWVTLGAYLNAKGFDDIIGKTYASQGYAAILTPLFIGVIADRFFSAEKLLSILHLAGAVLLFWLSTVGDSRSLFFYLVLSYMFLYMPTIPLCNAIAFNSMSNVEKQFPAIRVLGTIGWIAAGLIVGFLKAEQTNLPIQIAAGASVLMGLIALVLPKTPPKDSHSPISLGSMLGIDVLRQIRNGSFWIFILCSLLICIPLAFYYAYTNTFMIELGIERAAAIQTLGQMSEILFMLLLPLAFARLGIKYVLIVGMLAWAVRYVAFAYGYNGAGVIMPLVLTGILLHGICYDLFFVAGQIYVDRTTSIEIRSRAQAFLALVTLGIGTVVGSLLANEVYVRNTAADGSHNWQVIWLIPAVLSALVTCLFFVLFQRPSKQQIA